jgi:spore coat protein U-like protein
MSMNKKILVPFAAGALLGLAATGQAAQVTSSFNVYAGVQKNCLIQAQDMDFGYYNGTAELTAASAIAVRCSDGTPFSIALDGGSTSGDPDARLLSDGTNVLEYNLYTDAVHTTVWGDGTAGVVVSDTGTGLDVAETITKTVYGLLPNTTANQNSPEGNFSDTITVTVTY